MVGSNTSAWPMERCPFLNPDFLYVMELIQAFKQIAVQFLQKSPGFLPTNG